MHFSVVHKSLEMAVICSGGFVFVLSHNSQSYKIYILELERYQCVDIEMYADSKLSITKHHTKQS